MVRADKPIGKLDKKNVFVQFIKYALVGGIAAVADISVFYLFTGILNVNHILANTVSFSLGLLINYLLSREWVFGQYKHRFGRDFILFSVIGIIGLCISNLVLYILIDYELLFMLFAFAGKDVVKLIAKLTAVFIVLFWNFAARRRIVFHAA